MAIIRKALIVLCLLALAFGAWVWWSQSERVDMAAYVPADSLVYLEANDLPEIVDALTSTEAWREFERAEGAEAGLRGWDWLRRLAALTGVGRGEVVLLSRAQVAVTVLGFEAEEEPDATLKFSPRAALVAETHTTEWRVRPVIEKLVGDFARRSFDAPSVERKEVDGDNFVTWAEPSGSKRRIVAAVSGSVAVVGNDEAVVRACLEAKRGARPSLSGNEQLNEMRVRLGTQEALASGFAPRGSAAKVVEVLAPAFVGGITQKPEAQGIMATELPRLINQTVVAVGWSSRVVGGRVEDQYLLSLPDDMAERLQATLVPAANQENSALELLPQDAHQISVYTFRSPDIAWRSVNAALSARVDVSRAPFITFGLEALVKPYGIENPPEFLRACGTEIVTARLSRESEGKVLVATVRDEEALRRQVRDYLRGGARVERVGEAEMLVSAEAERGAASFAGGYLLTGSEEDVRACLTARAENRTLRGAEAFNAAARDFFPDPPFVRTLTDDRESARAVLTYFTRRGGQAAEKKDSAGYEQALARDRYSASETRMGEDGFEKKTRSSFGLLGELFTRLAPRR